VHLAVKHGFPYSGIQCHLCNAESSVAFVRMDEQVSERDRKMGSYVFEKALICHVASSVIKRLGDKRVPTCLGEYMDPQLRTVSDRFPQKFGYLHVNGKGRVHRCTGTEALYRPYGP